MKKIVLLIVTMLMLVSAQAGVVDHDKMFEAYLKGDLQTWKSELTKYTSTKNLTFDDKCEIANYLYGYIGFIVDGKGKKDEVEGWLKIFDSYIELMIKNSKTESMGHLYKAGSAGMKAKLYKGKLVSYGVNTLKELDKALEVDPNNPIAIGLKGNTKFYAPGILGGSKTKALSYYAKAIKMLQANCPKVYRWNLWALKLCVVEAYVGLGEDEKAKNYYEQVMRAEPRFTLLKRSYESGNFGNHVSE